MSSFKPRNCASCSYRQKTSRRGFYGYCGLWHIPIKDSYSGCRKDANGQTILRRYVDSPADEVEEAKNA